jgi:F-type H+-transporting ATPase subunit alpha
MHLLRQPQGAPFKLYEQVIILVAATAHTMEQIPVDDLLTYRSRMLEYFRTEEATLCDEIESSGVLSDDSKEEIIRVAKKFAESYVSP